MAASTNTRARRHQAALSGPQSHRSSRARTASSQSTFETAPEPIENGEDNGTFSFAGHSPRSIRRVARKSAQYQRPGEGEGFKHRISGVSVASTSFSAASTTVSMPASKRQKKGLGAVHDDAEPQFAIPMPKARSGSGSVYDFPASDNDGEERGDGEGPASTRRAGGAGTKNTSGNKRKRGRPAKSSTTAKTKKQQQQQQQQRQQEETQEVIYLATPRSQKRLPPAPPPEGQPRRSSNWRPPAVETEQEEEGQQDQSEEAGNLLNSLVGNVAAGPQMMTPPMTGSAGSPGTGKNGRAVNLRPRKVSGVQQQTPNQVEQHQSIDDDDDEDDEESDVFEQAERQKHAERERRQKADQENRRKSQQQQPQQQHENDHNDDDEDLPRTTRSSRHRQMQLIKAQEAAALGQNDDDEGGDDDVAAVNAALEFANQERLEGSISSSPAPRQKTKPNDIRSLISDSTSILREYLEDLCDPERSYFTSLPEWRTGFPQPLQSVITSVSKGSHPQPARGLRALEDYLYLLKELQEVIGKVRTELLKRHNKSTLAVFRRRVGIVDELIAEIELVFRRKQYVDSDGKKWEDVAQKRLKWLLDQRKITRKIEQVRRERAAKMEKARMVALDNAVNDLESLAVDPVNTLENPAADPVNDLDNLGREAVNNMDNLAGPDDSSEDYGDDDGQDDDEEMYTSDYTSEHDPIVIGGDAPVQRVRVDAFGNHERRQRPNTASPHQRRRQGSIVEDDIPWTKEEQIALWKAMATVVRENNGDLLWTQVVSGRAELTARGWEACYHEAKRVKDMMTAAGGRVPSWLVKV